MGPVLFVQIGRLESEVCFVSLGWFPTGCHVNSWSGPLESYKVVLFSHDCFLDEDALKNITLKVRTACIITN